MHDIAPRLQSALGLVVIFALAYFLSEKRSSARLRTAIAAGAIQLGIALAVLKLPPLRTVFFALNQKRANVARSDRGWHLVCLRISRRRYAAFRREAAWRELCARFSLPASDPCHQVRSPRSWMAGAGRLLGTKTVLNELLADIELSRLAPSDLGERGRLIMTYALCGFANFESQGILIAA